MTETATGTHFVYHRKLGTDPGWADRVITSALLVWEPDGYPVVRASVPSASAGAVAPGLVPLAA